MHVQEVAPQVRGVPRELRNVGAAYNRAHDMEHRCSARGGASADASGVVRPVEHLPHLRYNIRVTQD